MSVDGIIAEMTRKERTMTSKQREELQRISASFVTYPIGYGFLNLNCKMPLKEIKHIVDTILADPLRNCEVGTAEEQAERFDAYCDSHTNCAHCPLAGQQCVLAWSQMPYESEVK